MPRYAVAYHSVGSGTLLKVLEADSREQALRLFFDRYTTGYSKDPEGFAYFQEDFDDLEHPAGALTEIIL